ncbi:MAG: ParB/RepB/Spo0J family partition protein [Hyphomicrobiales bacterium]
MKSKKQALGRGLHAILQSPETDITSKDISGQFVVGAVAEIEIDKIEPNPFQPRKDFEEFELNNLKKSISELGVIQPITVRKLGYDSYQIISGERRWRACKGNSMKTIPAFIRVANDEQMLEMALIENIQRVDLNPVEIAISYKRLLEECLLTQEELSERIGKNRSTIANFIRLLKLPPYIQLALKKKTISVGHARAILNIEDEEYQKKIFNLIISQNLNVRQVEQLAKNQNVKKTLKKVSLPKEIIHIQNSLMEAYKTKVEVKRNEKGNGKLMINFKSDEDLERIVTLLSKY